MMLAVVGLVKWYKWTQISVVFTRGSTFKATVAALSHECLLSNVTVLASISFDEEVDERSMSDQLKAVEDLRSSRVVVAIALESTYWKVALAARARGMVTGWGWLALDTAKEIYYAPLQQRAEYALALNGWVFFEPYRLAGRDFFDRVHAATRVNFPTLFDENELPGPYAASMYDAITLFATLANQTWTPDQGGRAFVDQSSRNVSFEGADGFVKLDANAEAHLSYHVVNHVLKNGTLHQFYVGVFWAGNRSFSSLGVSIVWPGGVPGGSPSPPANSFSFQWVLVGAGIAAVMIMSGLVLLIRKRHANLQMIMVMLFTEV